MYTLSLQEKYVSKEIKPSRQGEVSSNDRDSAIILQQMLPNILQHCYTTIIVEPNITFQFPIRKIVQ